MGGSESPEQVGGMWGASPGEVGGLLLPKKLIPSLLPGYLCLYAEKDELLGATLILAWVPNSRIQRQDEEALRYITPESSPVRKAPRPRARRSQSSGAALQRSPAEPSPGLVAGDEDILVVAQNLQDTLGVSPTADTPERPGLDHRDMVEDEASLDLSAGSLSRASSFDWDSDAFSSPLCLSPVGGSVFPDSDSG